LLQEKEGVVNEVLVFRFRTWTQLPRPLTVEELGKFSRAIFADANLTNTDTGHRFLAEERYPKAEIAVTTSVAGADAIAASSVVVAAFRKALKTTGLEPSGPILTTFLDDARSSGGRLS